MNVRFLILAPSVISSLGIQNLLANLKTDQATPHIEFLKVSTHQNSFTELNSLPNQPDFITLIEHQGIHWIPAKIKKLKNYWPNSKYIIGDFDLSINTDIKQVFLNKILSDSSICGYFQSCTNIESLNLLFKTVLNGGRMINQGNNHSNTMIHTPSLNTSYCKHLAEALPQVSNRELDILDLLINNLNNEEIAEKLFLSKRTVETHISRMRNKLGFKTPYALMNEGLNGALYQWIKIREQS